MEWTEILKKLKDLAFLVVQLVIKLLLSGEPEEREVSLLKTELHDLIELSRKLDQVIAQGKVPGSGPTRKV